MNIYRYTRLYVCVRCVYIHVHSARVRASAFGGGEEGGGGGRNPCDAVTNGSGKRRENLNLCVGFYSRKKHHVVIIIIVIIVVLGEGRKEATQ